ncbi:MAG TPA: hypothetical protein PKA33_11455 [Amaricoccus sp.]|uniref:hypothetical protein n=1 Tax=Amaricoccus sp. TaxID=1872485 RepID=UPI002CC62A88|nr:hypothetical protein [Amaricoccus sp.]HMQ94068.1 hypothetical protein [Amaricoccus sp.]HMR53081.1 hypothetical protein [Amaricoccus sp.]HMR60371.1 hypothetical protein [Amaricoccus sp.]HMT99966.1 hypothetical protein [Amaricoccus sp.]
MRRLLFPALLALAATSARAAEILSAEAFERLAEGRTLHFTEGGRPYGSEQFLPGRRSLWRYAGEAECTAGSWRGEGEAICFRYDGRPEEICWRITREADGVFVELHDSDDGRRLRLGSTDTLPLPCPQTGAGT